MQNTFFRYEFKYRLSDREGRDIVNTLQQMGFEKDPRGDYVVNSLYFDSPDYTDYHDKAGGFLQRKKIRARIYGDTLEGQEYVWLEIKKKFDMVVHKKRVGLTHSEWDHVSRFGGIPDSARARLSDEEMAILREILYHVTSANRRPHLSIKYNRIPFEKKLGSERVRITLDTDMTANRSRSFATTQLPDKVLPGRAVLEVKFDSSLPNKIRWIIDSRNLRRDAHSKYAHAFESIRHYNKPSY